MSVVGECFFWYRLTRVVPDNFHRAIKRLCVCVCVLSGDIGGVLHWQLENLHSPVNMHTHADSTFDNCMTLTFDLWTSGLIHAKCD